jgi:cation diffusion facilitator family transporter
MKGNLMSNTLTLTEKTTAKVFWARLSVICNSVLIGMKLIVWMVSGSVAILSEAVHSGIDLLAALIAFLAIRTAAKPADECHPYGHGKYENISGLFEALLIIAAAIYIVYEAIPKLIVPGKISNLDLGIWVMLISGVVNYLIGKKIYKISTQTDSIALETDGAHHMVDVWTCLGVMAGLVAIRFTGLKILDPVISLGIALYIFIIGLQLCIKSVHDIVDRSLEQEDRDYIRNIINRYHGIIHGYHKLATRKSGSTKIIEFHLQFNSKSDLEFAHGIAKKIENEIKTHWMDSRILIHVEPCKEDCVICYPNDQASTQDDLQEK